MQPRTTRIVGTHGVEHLRLQDVSLPGHASGMSLSDHIARDYARTVAALGLTERSHRPGIPPALAISIDRACQAAPDTEDSLRAYYGQVVPRQWMAQQTGDHLVARLLRHPLDLQALPTLDSALRGLFAAVAQQGLDVQRLLGAPDHTALVSRCPTLGDLYARSLFGDGLPMLGATDAATPVLEQAVANVGMDATIDHYLSAPIVHELAHGRRGIHGEAPVAWMVLESAAGGLGVRAHRPHIYPSKGGEALPAAPYFILFAEVFGHFFGVDTMTAHGLGQTTLTEAVGPRVANALLVADQQDWLTWRVPPIANRADRPMPWLKWLDAARTPNASPLAPLVDSCTDVPTAATASNSVLDVAAATPWQDLPWWHQAPGPADLELLAGATDVFFAHHEMWPVHAPTPALLVPVPSDPPANALHLAVDTCVLQAQPRPKSVYGEPARWLIPPPFCRRLAERGCRSVDFGNVTHATKPHLQEALNGLVQGQRSLPPNVEVEL